MALGKERPRGSRYVVLIAVALTVATLPGSAPAAPQFGSSGPISIPGKGAATPYPSTIDVAGLAGVVTDVDVTVEGLSHPRPRDLDLLLLGPTGAHSLILSDVGGDSPVTGLTFTLDDDTTAVLSVFKTLTSGRFKPANPRTLDVLPPPAPKPSQGASLKRFDGTNPNGTWTLFVYDDDDQAAAVGSLGRWRLEITVAVPNVTKAVVREGGILRFTVRLSSAPGATSAPIALRFETIGGSARTRRDFKRVTGTLSFKPGTKTMPVSVRTRDDGRDEGSERLFLEVTDPTGDKARGKGRIKDND